MLHLDGESSGTKGNDSTQSHMFRRAVDPSASFVYLDLLLYIGGEGCLGSEGLAGGPCCLQLLVYGCLRCQCLNIPGYCTKRKALQGVTVSVRYLMSVFRQTTL